MPFQTPWLSSRSPFKKAPYIALHSMHVTSFFAVPTAFHVERISLCRICSYSFFIALPVSLVAFDRNELRGVPCTLSICPPSSNEGQFASADQPHIAHVISFFVSMDVLLTCRTVSRRICVIFF